MGMLALTRGTGVTLPANDLLPADHLTILLCQKNEQLKKNALERLLPVFDLLHREPRYRSPIAKPALPPAY
jgi:hypothetical protein